MKDKRLTCIGVFFCLCFALVALYLGSICIFKNESYSKSAALQRRETLDIKVHRGKFYDRNMIPLVESVATRMKLDENGVLNTEKGQELPYITSRYSKDGIAEHIIGYVDGEGKGICGMEKCFDKAVSRYEYTSVNIIKSADGKIINGFGMGFEPGKDATDGVKLTLDSHIQKICEEELSSNSLTGAVVVMDVDSFDVLAMASMPDYDQTSIEKYVKGDGSELVNRCISSYNAGSIFKIITMSSALETGRVRSEYICEGKTDITGTTFGCHKKEGHGILTLGDAFAKSCNCTFYSVGLDVGAEKLLSVAKDYGVGTSLLGYSDLEEAMGNIPQKPIYTAVDYANYAIGQGEVLITPLQAANMVCIVASDGISKEVNIADGIYSSDGTMKRPLRRVGKRRVIRRETAGIIQDSMCKTVESGTGKSLASSPAKIAGKTGTAETGWIEGGKMLEHGWFCGYFPFDNPQYAMAVLIENGGSGAVSAAPVFKNIAEKIIKIYPMG